MKNCPKRVDWLTIERFDQELVIFHHASKQALCLDSLATRVFDLCDGEHTAEQMARLLGDEAAVQQALDLLAEHHLLLEPEKLERRTFLQKAAMVAAILSVSAPDPALAASAPFCVHAADCNTGGTPSVAGMNCSGCDHDNSQPVPRSSECAVNKCLVFFVVQMSSDGSTVLSTNCTGDSIRSGVPSTCEQTEPTLSNPTPFWSRDCDTSRARVIAEWVARGSIPHSISNYKCCPTCCAVPCP